MMEAAESAEILKALSGLTAQVDSMLTCMIKIANGGGGKKATKIYITIHEAAEMVGKKAGTLRKLFQEEARDPNGMSIRREHGTVHLKDFMNFIESRRLASKSEILEGMLDKCS